MSEKNTAGKKVHTLTLEAQKKPSVSNEQKMEQGKIEIMKVVEGVLVRKSWPSSSSGAKRRATSRPAS